MLDRRQERIERRGEHIAKLNRRAAETDLRLKRLYHAIETGVAKLDDPALKERGAGLKAIRDLAQADAERAYAHPSTIYRLIRIGEFPGFKIAQTSVTACSVVSRPSSRTTARRPAKCRPLRPRTHGRSHRRCTGYGSDGRH